MAKKLFTVLFYNNTNTKQSLTWILWGHRIYSARFWGVVTLTVRLTQRVSTVLSAATSKKEILVTWKIVIEMILPYFPDSFKELVFLRISSFELFFLSHSPLKKKLTGDFYPGNHRYWILYTAWWLSPYMVYRQLVLCIGSTLLPCWHVWLHQTDPLCRMAPNIL